jgi:hypothetical protein
VLPVERAGSCGNVNEVVMTAGNVNGNTTTGSAVVTPLRQHRPISANPKQQPILSRQSAAATTMYGDREDGRRTAASVKLWLIRGVVQVSARCIHYYGLLTHSLP